MSRLRLLLRLIAIEGVLVRHGLDELIRKAHLMRPVRLMLLIWPGSWGRRRRQGPRGVRIREALEELGPIFVKFGQSLSTRPDLLPADVARELAKLQDQVPPFPAELAQAEIRRALGQSPAGLFAEFDPQPLAAASIAQVHAARLHSGEEVVVKVLRPDVEALIDRDIQVLYAIARLAHRYWPEARRLRPLEVVEEYDKTCQHELDLLREAANAALLKRNFAGSAQIYVPAVYWDYCRERVMVMERIHGIPINRMDALRAAKTNIPKLAANGVEIFFTQVFRDNFFHADMHPGNIFVDVSDPENPRYAAVDFGIVGTLADRDRRYLAENFLAFFDHDYRRVAQLHVDSGWVPHGTRVDELESAVRTVCEPIMNKPLKDISFGQVLMRLFQVARRFDMEIQPQLILLQKTLLQIEGLGRELYPELDLWQTGRPVLKKWMAEQTGARATAKRIARDLPEIRYVLERLPAVARRLVDQAIENDGRLPLPDRQTVRARERRQFRLVAGAAALVAGALLIGLQAAPAWLGWAVGAVGLVGIFSARPPG